ncbi:potassium uptake TrkH family protein [Gracilibacillus halotolerans]|uniref:Potassium uptake TrkH family protein n=1 Tax=Gracilibacillus halotolerans TaxID=74386 RepID=A0A841RND5_9BACI|nr:TrkH family potassium uptake protein [Gracilibacillus halotolerans]MBB6514351.1 potassium uptake TrkH family protein [Gracilibacillus halotolerans]
MSLVTKLKESFKNSSAFQHIVVYYLITVAVSTLIVSLPFLHNEGVELSFIDSLFTAITAISVTGLTVVSISETFNTAGQFAIAIILHLGGIGIMTMGTFIWVLLGKKIGIRSRKMIMVDQNQKSLAGLVKLMMEIFILILIIEVIGTILFTIHFLQYFEMWTEALFHAFFLSVSATTNGGLDITGASLMPYQGDYFVQSVTMILIVLGAIGFPVLVEVKEYIQDRIKNGRRYRHRFSLFTKITTLTYFLIMIIGAIVIYLLEHSSFMADKSWHEAFFYSLFHSVAARSAGLTTMDISSFSLATLTFISLLMFIGASPSSVGGGIRTTTFAIMLLAVWNYAKGNASVKVFSREIHQDDILRAFIVISTALLLCSSSVIVLSYTENFTLTQIIFEVTSAFGTTGTSMGITSELTSVGKFVIMILMFIGRIGIFTFLFIIRGHETKDKYHYPTERVIIG